MLRRMRSPDTHCCHQVRSLQEKWRTYLTDQMSPTLKCQTFWQLSHNAHDELLNASELTLEEFRAMAQMVYLQDGPSTK